MSESEPAIRRATADDMPLLTETIRLAFADDPIWGRALARADGRINHHATFWQLFVEGALRHSWTWLANGGVAMSMWIPPGGTELTPEQEERLAGIAKETLGPTADEFRELLERFDTAHPRAEPHYYLSLLATHPAHRGHGFGMRLLAHDLALIDEQHAPAYLESSNPANDARYRGVGFEGIGEFSYPGDGPIVTTMWRPAR